MPSWLTGAIGSIRDFLRDPRPFLRAWWSHHPLRIPQETTDQAAVWTIVWMMIPVAILVAITVYGASIAEHRAAQLERRLAQTHVAENLFRAAARLIVSRRQAVADRARELQAQSGAERAAAARLSGAPGSPADASAAELDLLAQENDAVYRLFAALGIVRKFGPADEEVLIDRVALQGVIDMGLGPEFSGRRTAKAASPAHAGSGEKAGSAADLSPRIVVRDPLKHQIERIHNEVKWRASAVVALVGALVCFTLAAMRAGRTRLVLAVLGAAVATLTTGATLAIVRPAWGEIVVQLLIVAFPLLMLQRGHAALAASATPHSLESEEAGLRSYARRVQAGHAHSPFARRILYAIAATAVVSALTDYGYSRVAVTESTAAHEAFEHEGEFTRGVLEWTAKRVQMFETTTQLLEARVRTAVSWARSELGYLGPAAARARARAEVWQAQLRDLEKAHPVLVGFLDDPVQGLDGSAPFYRASVPWDLPLAAVGNPGFFRAMALWDAENERAIQAHRSKTALLQALTIFAIAFYFFGQALGLGEASPGARWLFAVGVLLALAGSAWGLKEWTTSLASAKPRVSDRCPAFSADPARDRAHAAAEYFDRARRARLGGERSEAVQALDCAIELRPTFAAALGARLGILEDENADLRDLNQLAAFYEDAHRKVGALERALERSELVAPFSLRLWRERLRLWPAIYRAVAASRLGREVKLMDRREREARARSLGHLAGEAEDRLAHFDLAVYFLAVQRFEEAEREMNLGFDAPSADHPSRYPEMLAPGVLDDLAVLDEYCERALKSADCRRLIRAMKDRSAARQAGRSGTGRKIQGDVAITRVTPLGVDWKFGLASFDPKRDLVYTRVYRADAIDTPYLLDLYELTDATIAPDGAQPGRYVARQGFLAGSYCHDGVSFRGEMYVNGQWLGEASWTMTGTGGPGRPSDMMTAMFPELNLVLCHPADWKALSPDRLQSSHVYRANNASGGDPRLTRGWVTATDAPAALVFNQYTAGRFDAGAIFEDTMSRVRRMGLVDSLPPIRYDCSGGPGDRRVLARTWRDRSSGVVYVAFVFPDRQRPGAECQVMESIQQLIFMR